MLRLGIQSSGFETECKISGCHGSVDSHNFFPGYVTIRFGKLPTIQDMPLLCLKAFTCLGCKDNTFFLDSGIHFMPYMVP